MFTHTVEQFLETLSSIDRLLKKQKNKKELSLSIYICRQSQDNNELLNKVTVLLMT